MTRDFWSKTVQCLKIELLIMSFVNINYTLEQIVDPMCASNKLLGLYSNHEASIVKYSVLIK